MSAPGGYERKKIFTNIFDVISDALRDLVPFVRFKKREKHPRSSVTFSKVAGLKVTLLSGCFSRFLICKNGTKSRNASLLTLQNFISKTYSIVVTKTHGRHYEVCPSVFADKIKCLALPEGPSLSSNFLLAIKKMLKVSRHKLLN